MNLRYFIRCLLIGAVGVASTATAATAEIHGGFIGKIAQRKTVSPKPNVLMILVDDLKPALGCYEDQFSRTPHLDELAGRGLRFDLAYCNQAVCAPSRFTLMLGSHATSTGLYGLGNHLRKTIPTAKTLPQYFFIIRTLT